MSTNNSLTKGLSTKQLALLAKLAKEKKYALGNTENISDDQPKHSAIKPIVRTEEFPDHLFPPSFGQERLWFFEQFDPGSSLYHEPFPYRIAGILDYVALEKSLNAIIARHEVLRTVFVTINDKPWQKILPELTISLSIININLDHLSDAEQQAEVFRLAQQEIEAPMSLENGPLLRAALFRLGENEHILFMTRHHIVTDGWSVGVFAKELSFFYKMYCNGDSQTVLPELPMQYVDYAIWQRQQMQGQSFTAQLDYWRKQLAGTTGALDLPTDYPRPSVQVYTGAERRGKISLNLTNALKALSRQEGATLFMTLFAAFQTLLYRYTRQSDISVATMLSNRTRIETEATIGFLANTLILRSDLSGSPTFVEFLQRVKETALDAYANQELPFDALVNALNPKRDLSRNVLFDALFIFQNVPVAMPAIPGLTFTDWDYKLSRAFCDLTLSVFENEAGLYAVWEYNADLFDQSTIDRMIGHYQQLLAEIVLNPSQTISELPLLSEAERQQILVDWNNTHNHYPQDKSIHQLVEEQVKRTPENIAVSFEGQSLTYHELNQRANQLAYFLQKQGVGPDVLVAICVERSLDMLISLLGILKAGGAYLPLDPKYPEERIAYILADAQVKTLITQNHLLASLPDSQTVSLCLDTDWAAIASVEAEPAPATQPANLAYTIYTSGSTGKPKGVQVSHRAVVNFLNSMKHTPGITAEDVLLAVTTLSFDIAGLEMFLPLTVGARVEIVRRDTAQDAEQLHNALIASGATIMQATPVTWKMLLEINGLDGISLKVLCGGEALPPDLAQSIARHSAELWNLYGPTETTIWSAQKRLGSGDAVTIGHPINNTQLYILDSVFQPVPIGVPGELCISGDGLARGYLNRPDLTAEKFIPNPFLTVDRGPWTVENHSPSRLYRTGDLTRWLPDGSIEYLGRLDHQIKIRGFRIELGEIEVALSQHPDIRESVVLAREDIFGDPLTGTGKRLVAYLILNDTKTIEPGELRTHLKGKLPEYMVPSAFVFLNALPLTPNGKLDRKALPAPDASLLTTEYIAPRTPTEEILAAIWAEVLKLEKVGIHDDFFELGGHSLLATQVISRMRKAFGVDMLVRSIFEAPTLTELAASVETTRLHQAGREFVQIPLVLRDQPLPLSFAQERLWFLDQFEGSSATYNIPLALVLKGSLDFNALEKAIAEIIQRHETLRTVFVMIGDKPSQQIIPTLAFSLPQTDLSFLAQDSQEEQVRHFMIQESEWHFDLSQGPLLRTSLLRLSEQEHILLINMHHIISDGWSIGILTNELSQLYLSKMLPQLPIQYVDFAAWQRTWLQNENLEKQLTYWKKQLAGAPALLELPTNRARPAIETFHGKTIGFELDPKLTKTIKTISRQHNTTLFMTLYAAFAVLLSRYSRQDDIVIGSPIANRNRAEIEPLIGFFVNTLALRADLSANPTFGELLQQVQRTTLDAYAHQDLPFEKLVAELQPERSMSYSPIFQVMFALQNAPSWPQMPGLDVSFRDFESTITKFDLTLDMEDLGDNLTGSFEYNTDLFDEATIYRMITHWQILLAGIVSNPEQTIASLPIITEAERQQIVVEWNHTYAEYPQDRYIHQRFEEQVEQTPENIAVTFEDQSLNYRELNQRANQLAHSLQKRGVGPDVLVGICVERSIEMVVGILAILKAGGAYLPLDPAYPKNRLEFMLVDAKPAMLLTQSTLVDKFPNYSQSIICLDTDWGAIAQENTKNLSQVAAGTNLAYVIYTSGSTGQPKGVMIQHQSMMNYCQGAVAAYDMRPSDRVLQFASLSFDTSVEEIYPCLISGATLVLRTETMIGSISSFLQKCDEWSLTILNIPTAFWQEWMAELKSDQLPMPPSLRLVIIGGEGVLSERVSWWQKFVSPQISLINTYGASEATAVTTIGTLLTEQKTHIASIGQPAANIQVFILDSHMQPTPVGILGELCIGGAGLARGYLNRPDLTAEKFIPNPFSVLSAIDELPNGPTGGERLYRTGDLARWLPDGNIEYLGRMDQQVKIRGFRIELGEIEDVLGQYPDVRESVVLARDTILTRLEDTPGDQMASADKRLVAYLVLHQENAIKADELRAYLKGKLPEYMVPFAFIILDALPLTPNGKLDRSALPAPDASLLVSGYVAPRTPTEEILSNIWAEVLRLEKVGIHNNFFELGGHSLLATQVISRLRRTFQIDLPVRSLFEAPTLVELATAVEAARLNQNGHEFIPILPISRDQPLPLSFAQERLWFLNQLEGGSTTYNIPFALRLKGNLDIHALEKALAEIVWRHEVLRTVFITIGDQVIQQIISNLSFSLLVTDQSALVQDEQAKQLRHRMAQEAEWPFDLAEGPLLRVSLFRLSEQNHILLLNTPHIISDGWSSGVLTKELATLYSAFLVGLPSPLSPLPIQYADFAIWQRTWLQGETLEQQVSYWKHQLAGAPALLKLPTDRLRPAIQTNYGKTIRFELDVQLTQTLKMLSRQENATLFMTLYAAFAVLLSRYSRQDDIVIGSPIANRNRAEIEPLIGFFVNTLALRADLSGDPIFSNFLSQVRQTTLNAYAHQDLPFEKLVEELHPERSLSYSPIFQVMFILQNAPGGKPHMPGLDTSYMEFESATAKFDLTVALEELDDRLAGYFEYNTDLFDEATIQRMIVHFETLLRGIGSNPRAKVSNLPLLTDFEKQQILVEWNNTHAEFPNAKDKCIHQLFEEQVERTPDNVALVFEGQSLTYRQLNERANQLAHFLQKQGVGPDVLVGLCMDRSLNWFIALLGILKANGAYLPIEPALPIERLKTILDEAGVLLVITQQHLAAQFPTTLTVFYLDTASAILSAQSSENITTHATPANLAYVIFTSGSTGKPKGVAIGHEQIVNYLYGITPRLSMATSASYTVVSTLAADLGYTMIFPALCNGGQLHVISEERASNPMALADYCNIYPPDALKIVPSHLMALLNTSEAANLLPRHRLVLGGEALSWQMVSQIKQVAPLVQILNHYGPTESTVGVLTYPIEQALNLSTVPLGRPLNNILIYLLDAGLQPVPIGVPGELCIGGAGLARGYLKRPDLTAEKFIANPFSAEPGERMYRTGDLARWLPDGNIEYLGRIDQQVKIRGFRIELGEIEVALSQYPDVHENVVLALEDASGIGKRLVAYLVAHQGKFIETGELRAYLKRKLPEYMIPTAFIFLEALPLTINSKLDRKALPAPDASLVTSGYVAPRTPTEEILTAIWAEVLKVEKVGIHDNFFELGGHSLLATQVISRLRKAFRVEISVRRLFENPTLVELAGSVDAVRLYQTGQEFVQILPVSHDYFQSLSFAQERLWFLDQLEGGSATYNVSFAFRLQGSININLIEKSMSEIIRRHEVLRTVFVTVGNELIQKITPNLVFSLPVTDLSDLPADIQTEQVRHCMVQEAEWTFDLTQGPLLRASLLKLSEEQHILLFNLHHIVSDGWSTGIIIYELKSLYAAFLADSPSPLPELPIQYADFAAWQRTWLQGENLERQLSYWKKQLAGAPALLELPTDRPRPAIQTFHGKTIDFELDPQLAVAIKALSRQNNTTLFMTLYAAFAALLSRYSRQDDIVIGSPIANRNHAELEPLIGFFVNTLVLRADLSGNPTFSELLGQAQRTTLDAYTHQDVPFEKLVAELHPERTLSYSPLFQAMFILQNAPDVKLQISGLDISFTAFESTIAKFDLSLAMADTGRGLAGSFEYNTDLFDEASIRRMIGHWQILLNGIISNPGQKVASLPMLTEAERRQVLVEWNKTQREYPKDKSIHQLFEEQAERTPENIAVTFNPNTPGAGGQSLTYRELNERANQLAHSLQKLGIKPDELVGLCMERSLEMFVSILGILKAGGAYLPIDSNLPAARIEFMIKDASVRIVLTQSGLSQFLPTDIKNLLQLDTIWPNLAGESVENIAENLRAGHLAYAMYTSGTTGVPKAVCVTHRNVVRLVMETDFAHFSAQETFLQFAPISFDASTLEIWGALLHGAKLVIAPQSLTLSELGETIQKHQVSFLWLTAALFAQMVDDHIESLKGVRQLLAGGDVLSPAHVRKLALAAPGCQIINGYGPTENTTFTACFPVTEDSLAKASLPIGRAIRNTQIYLLNQYLEPVPVGIPGELYTTGAGVARGYLNRADLTGEKFIPNPFSVEGGARMYRTGDLCRWLPDGNIEYLGRIDQQVKLRGFRIELGEIESVLSQHPDVRESVVLALEDTLTGTGKRLVAYLVLRNTIETGELRAHLKAKLPEYMIPSAFVFLDALPLTPNGKLDRKALPAPESSLLTSGYVAPHTPTEEILANIWADVLKVEKIGIYDNFFELGGHSLLATQVISRLRKAFHVELPVRSLFESPTITSLADFVETARLHQPGHQAVQILPVPRNHPLPLSFAQERLWFLNQLDGGTATYNIPFALHLHGSLNINLLEKAIREIIQRHEVLRTVFITVNDIPVQKIVSTLSFSIVVTDLSTLKPDEQASQVKQHIAEHAEQPFDLSDGPLLRVNLLKTSSLEHTLLLTMHHIISDGWSTGILMGELTTLYSAFLADPNAIPLPELPIQYADFAAWQRNWLQGDNLDRQISYWKQELTGAPSLLELPTDHPRPAIQTFHGKTIGFELNSLLTQAIKTLSRQHNTTLFMTLYAAFAVLLSRYSRQDDIVIGSPIASRNRAEIEGLIGFFVNTLALRADLSANPTFSQLLQQVQRTTLDAYTHQDLPFEKLVAELHPERSLSYSPLFQVMFILQNATNGDIQMPDFEISYMDFESSIAKFDLTLGLIETKNGLAGSFEYNTDLFDEATIQRMIVHWQTLLSGIVSNPGERIASLPIITVAERQQILVEWNDTRTHYLQEKYIHQLFEEQVEKTPDAIALVFETQSLTYRELNQRANQLAYHLQKHGVGPDVLVGICIDRSLEMVIGLYAILKAGGAYLPIDPNYPQARIEFMLQDSHPGVILIGKKQLNIVQHQAVIIDLEQDWSQFSAQSTENPSVALLPDNLAYMIYTSGSTGKPKGAMNSHAAILNRLLWMQSAFPLTPDDHILQKTPFSFDVSVWEFFWPLMFGARLVVTQPEGHKDPHYLAQTIKRENITTLHFVPSMLAAFLETEEMAACSTLRRVICSGEALPLDLLQRFQQSSNAELHNLYGPTEAAVDVSWWPCLSTYIQNIVPIGHPIANIQLYILTKELMPIPMGIAGELYIAGIGLARGYLNRPDLTAEKFIPNPFAADGSRMYRTGDLACWLPDGNIEYLGRIDQQVKIRGFRIELGEIETVLNQHPDVNESAVLAREDIPGDKRLVAYLVGDNLDVNELRAHLKAKLPEYMLPSNFVFLEALPLTPNGKLDRKALPAPDANLLASLYIAPRTPTEETLAGIWADVIKVEKVGIHDNFFELGGHSLLATQVVSRLRKTLQIDLPVRSLFESPTLAELALSINNIQRRIEQIQARKLDLSVQEKEYGEL